MAPLWGKRELTIESLCALRGIEKLNRAKIKVYAVKENAKNSISFTVNAKDLKKVFAILQGSCYNIRKVRPIGGIRLVNACLKRAGLIAGLLLFVLSTLFFQSRILKVEVVGSGAYYESEVVRILKENGVKPFCVPPRKNGAMTAEILSLPRVCFCETQLRGGIFTVTVEVTDEENSLTSAPLVAPVTGRLEELVVVRGTPQRAQGDDVNAGDILVENVSPTGTGKSVIVIASAIISYSFRFTFTCSEEEARAQAILTYGQIREIHIEEFGEEKSASGVALISVALNLG